MEQCSSCEADICSASYEIPALYGTVESEGLLLCSQEPAAGLYPEPDEYSPL
jgi:hypothetical protein